MEYRSLGQQGLQVSSIGFGGWGAEPLDQPRLNESLPFELVRQAVSAGISCFDTADSYDGGLNEACIGATLSSMREEIVLATKTGGDFNKGSFRQDFSFSALSRSLDKSRARFGTDCIDVYQLHNPPVELVTASAVRRWMEKRKARGKIQVWGATSYSIPAGIAMAEAGQIDVLQQAINALDPPSLIDTLLTRVEDAGIGLIVRESRAGAFLHQSHEERGSESLEHPQFFSTVLSHDQVACLILSPFGLLQYLEHERHLPVSGRGADPP